VPTDPDDVQTAVAHFFLVPEEVALVFVYF
jgi:hypothetical protein